MDRQPSHGPSQKSRGGPATAASATPQTRPMEESAGPMRPPRNLSAVPPRPYPNPGRQHHQQQQQGSTQNRSGGASSSSSSYRQQQPQQPPGNPGKQPVRQAQPAPTPPGGNNGDEESEDETDRGPSTAPFSSVGNHAREGYTLVHPRTTFVKPRPEDFIPGPRGTREIRQKDPVTGESMEYWLQEREKRITASNLSTIFGLYSMTCPKIARFLSDRRDDMARDYWEKHKKCPPYMTAGVMRGLVDQTRQLKDPGPPDGYEFQQVIRRLRKEPYHTKNQTAAMTFGIQHEDTVRRIFAEAAQLPVYESGFIINSTMGYRGGSADLWMLDGREIGEIKCQSGGRWTKPFTDLEMARGFDILYMAQPFDNAIHSLYAKHMVIVVAREKEIVWTRFPKKPRICELQNKLIGWWYRKVVMEKEYMMATAEDWLSDECPVTADYREYITLLQEMSLSHPFHLLKNSNGKILKIVGALRPEEWVETNMRRRVDVFGDLATLNPLGFGDEELKRKKPLPYTQSLPPRLFLHSSTPVAPTVVEDRFVDDLLDMEEDDALAVAAAEAEEQSRRRGGLIYTYIYETKEGKRHFQAFKSLGDDGRDTYGTLRDVLGRDLRSAKKRMGLVDVKVVWTRLREAPHEPESEILLWMTRESVKVDARNLVQKWSLVYLPPPEVEGGFFLTSGATRSNQ